MLGRNKLFVGEIIVCSAHSTLLVSLFFELYVFFRADKLCCVEIIWCLQRFGWFTGSSESFGSAVT